MRGVATDFGDISGLPLGTPNCPLSCDELLSREPCRSYEMREYSSIGGDVDVLVSTRTLSDGTVTITGGDSLFQQRRQYLHSFQTMITARTTTTSPQATRPAMSPGVRAEADVSAMTMSECVGD